MASICSINTIEKSAKQFVEHYMTLGNSQHSIESVLGAISEFFDRPDVITRNKQALSAISKLLKDREIEVDLNSVFERSSQTCPFLKEYTIQSEADLIPVFKTNQKSAQYLLKRFSQEAFKYCIMDNTNSLTVIPFVTTNEELQINIAKWKNQLISDLLYAVSRYNPSAVDTILEKAGVSNIRDLVVFNSKAGADVDLYYEIMRAAKDVINGEKLDSFDFLKGNMLMRRVLYSLTALNNFDALLEQTMKDVVAPDKRNRGDLNRTDYKKIGALDGSKQDLMGISDYDYENALNYISVSLEKIISNIPLVTVSLRRSKGSDSRFQISKTEGSANTMTISHILQSTAWLHSNLPELSKYLNIGSIDLLSNPQKVLSTVLGTIHEFITDEWDSTENSSDILIGQDIKKSRAAVKRILKNSGPGLNTLMSLHEFLFNSKNRINGSTKSILQMQHDLRELSPKFNIIAEVAGQMISSVAPALIEYNTDGTIFDASNLASPNSTNYIQKASKNKAMFTLRNFLRSHLLVSTLTGKTDYIDVITKVTQGKGRKNLAECLKLKEFRYAAASIFGITDANEVETLSALLLEAEEELGAANNTLYNMFLAISDSQINLQTTWSNGSMSVSDLYDTITAKLNNILNNGKLKLDIVGRALAPILSTAPTPTFFDRNGNQLGVYRTTSLAFMFPHMVSGYKKNIIEKNIGDPDYTPLRQRCNILVDNNGLLEMGENPMYESTVSIPLSMGNEETNLEARKQPEFVQDLRQFMGDFMSLVNARQNNQKAAMMGIQLGTYSDKTTLPMLMFNLLTKQGKMPYTQAFLQDPFTASRKMYAYEATQKLDLANKILTDWRTILKYIQSNLDTVLTQWDLSDNEKKIVLQLFTNPVLTGEEVQKKTNSLQLRFNEEVSKLNLNKRDQKKLFIQHEEGFTILNPEFESSYPELASISKELVQTSQKGKFSLVDIFLQNFSKTGILESLTSLEYSKEFDQIAKPKLVIGNKGLDSTSNAKANKFINTTQQLYTQITEAAGLLTPILNLMPGDGFNLRVLNRAAFISDIQLVEKFHYDKYSNGYDVNHMLFDDVDIACNQSIIPSNETDELIEGLLEQLISDNVETVEEALKTAETLSYPTRMVLAALSKKYWINGREISFYEYLGEYFKDNQSTILELINIESKDSIGAKLFGKMFTSTTVSHSGYKSTSYEFNPLGLIAVYRTFLLNTNFLRHQALDISIKEAYEDKGANADVKMERYLRQLTTSKRNNTLTAPIRVFNLGLLNGVNQDNVNMAIVEDFDDFVFNTIGADTKVDGYDGVGFTSPYQARQESASLGELKHTPVKKTFITPIHDYYAEELKWASNEITNQLIRESRGSEVNLYDVFKAMHSFPFGKDVDITKRFKYGSSNKINIKNTLGQEYFAKEGFNYYRYDAIVSNGNSTYTVYRTKVDEFGKPLPSSTLESKPVHIDSIFEIYDALNGVHGMSLVNGKLEYSESIHDFIYELITQVGEFKGRPDLSKPLTQDDVKQPLRDKMIHILATNSANKRGAANVIPNTLWKDPLSTPWYYTKISLATGGKQLDAEHEADQSHITKGTQLLQCLAQKGYTAELVTKVYEAIARAMQVSSDSFNEIETILRTEPKRLPQVIAKRVMESVEVQGNTLELQTMISAFVEQAAGKPVTLPLSLLTKEVIKSIAPELNHVIKQKDSGLMGVLNAASGFVQVYNIGGQTFTSGSLLSDQGLQHIRPYRIAIESYLKNHPGLDFDTVVTRLSIISWNTDFEQTLLQYSDIDATTGKPVTTPNEILIERLLDDAFTEHTFLDLDGKVDQDGKVLSYQRIQTSELQPGDWYIKPILDDDGNVIGSEGPIKLEKAIQLQELLVPGKIKTVYLVKHKPVDLQPNIRQVDTQSYSENEYTSYEAIFDYHIKEHIETGTNTEVDELTNYLYNVDNNNIYQTEKDFRYLQEDMVNFKNHIKAFGFTLKQAPPKAIDVDAEYEYSDFYAYYGYSIKDEFGNTIRNVYYDPTKDFEQQMQENIIKEYLENPEMFQLIIKGLTFASQAGTLDSDKKSKLQIILNNPQAIVQLCKENPGFVFSVIPLDKNTMYKKYMSSHPDMFIPINSISLRTAQIVMPPIYAQQMGTAGKDIIDMDLDYFRKSNDFYKISQHVIEEDKVDVDFTIRTFRGQYHIVVADDLSNKELDKYGITIDPEIKNGKRVDPRSQQVIYNEPNSNYIIKKHKGVETLILRASSNIHEDIYQIVNSDPAVVSVQPFLSRMDISNKQASIRLLNRMANINTISAFDLTYETIINMVTNGQIDTKGMYDLYNDSAIEYKDKYAASMYHSFLRSLDMIATRIPTQNMSSIMPMRVASLLNSSVNNVFVTKWQQWLQGADYDIDKAFLLGYNFDEKGMFIRWSNQQKFYTPELFEESLKIPLPTGKRLDVSNGGQTLSMTGDIVDARADKLVSDYLLLKARRADINTLIALAEEYDIELSGDDTKADADLVEIVIFGQLVDRINQVDGLYINPIADLNKAIFVRLIEKINAHNQYRPKVQGINNYSTYITHQVLNDPRNATTTYKSIDIATEAFNGPIRNIKWESRVGNNDDGHTISQTTASGAVGKDGVGIGANGTKVYFTLLNYYNRSFFQRPPFDSFDLLSSPYFNVSKLSLNYTNKRTGKQESFEKYIGPISDTRLTRFHKKLYNDEILRGFGVEDGLYLYDRDAAQDVGALLSMAADNAKTLNLDKLHADTDYFAMHIYLAMVGVPAEVIISYFNSDTFLRVIRNAQNDLAKGQIPMVTEKSFKITEDMSDQEKFDMAQLRQIYLAAKEVTALAQILSINQGIKVEEEEIIAQRSKCENIYESTLQARGLSKEARFKVEHISSIVNLHKEVPSQYKDAQAIRHKMDIANEAMDKVKGGMRLSDKFDFDRFLSEADYAKAVIAIFDVIKYNYNVFDVITQAPHFLQMLKSYNSVLQAYAKSDKQLDFILNESPDTYNTTLINKDSPYGEYSRDMYVEERFSKKMISKAKGYFQQKTLSVFIANSLDPFGFTYTPNHGPSVQCSFKTDNALHRFVDFVNGAVIPQLMEQDPENKFLQGLEINEAETKEIGIPFFGFNENLKSMGHKDFVGASKLTGIQQGFDRIANIKIKDLLKDAGNITFKGDDSMTVGDALWLYNTLMRQVSPRSNDLSPLFSTLNKAGTWKMNYQDYIRQLDLGEKKIAFDKHELMAFLYKNSAFMYERGSEKSKEIRFTDSHAPEMFKIVDNKTKRTKYTRFLVGMTYITDSKPAVIHAERFISAYLNGTIKVLNC